MKKPPPGPFDPAEAVDLGLVTATVTAPALPQRLDPPTPAAASVPAAPAVPSPVQPVALPDGWDLHKVAELVRDVAADMYELPYILEKHKLAEPQYRLLQKNVFFQRALEAEIITWQGVGTIQRRLALEAAIAVEDAMPDMAARLRNKTEPLGEAVTLLKVLAEMSGTIGKAQSSTTSNAERIKIVINLGENSTSKEVAVEAGPVIEHAADG